MRLITKPGQKIKLQIGRKENGKLGVENRKKEKPVNARR
jgi:hypothetical protein